MAEAGKWDLVVKNVRVVRPQGNAVHEADIAIDEGKFAKIGGDIPAKEAKQVYDGKGRLAFPGVVDAHMHAGIYSPLSEDAVSESKAAAQGGETAEIMTAYTKIVESAGKLQGLEAYHAARPPHSEGLAVFIASYLANETALPNINLLHLSSRKALGAALQMQAVFPHIDFRREVTIGHLVLDVSSKAGPLAKVNPPIRPREDVEYLWQQVLAGNVHWVVSDHACCRHETKVAKKAFGNIWLAKSGFGGTEYLLPALVSEGSKRGLSYNR